MARQSRRNVHRRSGRIPVLGVVLLCLLLSLSLAVGTTLAVFTASKSLTSSDLKAKNVSLSVRSEDSDSYITEPMTLNTRLMDTPYSFTIIPQGEAAGYCQIRVTTNGQTVTKYIYPITETVDLSLYAAANSEVSFSSGWGTPALADETNSIHPVSGRSIEDDSDFSVMRMSAQSTAPQVVLHFSENTSVVYPYSSAVKLQAIAAHYGVSEQDILTFNGLSSQEELYDGMDLYIPNPSTTDLYTPPGLYRVQAGDTLEQIAETYGVTVRSLRQWNNIFDVTQLGVGMMLKIPVIYQPDPADDVPMNTTPVDPVTDPNQPAETEPVQPEPTETAPAETEPQETEPVETEPMETETMETDPTETESAASEPAVTEPTDAEPTGTEPAETEPTASEPEATQPAATEPVTLPSQTVKKENVSVCGVPLYFQGDYPDSLYGSGTVKTSGCSVTSLTMVANAITGYDYTVDELADYFGGVADSNMDRLEKGSDALGLKWYKSENWDKTWEALQEGKIVIALMDGESHPGCLFTSEQHFIVLAGLNEAGRIMVNDPNEGNYGTWELKDGFENGFTAQDILSGYSGAWVYDRTLDSRPERYTAYRAPKYNAKTNNGGVTPEERYLLACLIWGEARGESIYGQQAVAEVVLNRLASGKFGSSITQIIQSPGQFRSVTAGQLEVAQPTQAQYQAIDRALFGKRILPESIYYFSVYAGNADVYIQVGNHLFNFTAS